MKYPARTYQTNISDSKLIILDFLFDAYAPMKLLRNEVFSIHQNLSYTHGLNDGELESMLEDYIEKDILYKRKTNIDGKDISLYGFTSKGGRLWEKERQPIWNLYLNDSIELTNDGKQWLVRLKSTSIETLKASLHFCVENAFYGLPLTKPIHNVFTKSDLIYWKYQINVHEYTYIVHDCEEYSQENWQKYDNERVWWRTIEELQKFIA